MDERGAPSAGGRDERVGGAVELDEVRHRGLAAVVAEDAPLGGVARPGVHLHRPRRGGGAGIGRDRRPPEGGAGRGPRPSAKGRPRWRVTTRHARKALTYPRRVPTARARGTDVRDATKTRWPAGTALVCDASAKIVRDVTVRQISIDAS